MLSDIDMMECHKLEMVDYTSRPADCRLRLVDYTSRPVDCRLRLVGYTSRPVGTCIHEGPSYKSSHSIVLERMSAHILVQKSSKESGPLLLRISSSMISLCLPYFEVLFGISTEHHLLTAIHKRSVSNPLSEAKTSLLYIEDAHIRIFWRPYLYTQLTGFMSKVFTHFSKPGRRSVRRADADR